MKKICIVCSDKVFSRMLELEIKELGIKVKTIFEKLSEPAINLVWAGSDIVVLDAEYLNYDMALVGKSDRTFVVFSNEKINGLPENVTAFFERPFVISEFLKHIRSLADSDKDEAVRTLPESIGVIELDPYSKQATVNGVVIKFSPREFTLLSLLCKNRGKIVSRKDVLDTVWGDGYDDNNNVDNVYINYLRNKLDKRFGVKMIYTVRGRGYMLK